MVNIPGTQATDGAPTYLGRGDPAGRFADYHPAWVDNLAADVTLEGSMLDGARRAGAADRSPLPALSSLLLFSRLRETFAGTPYAEHLLAGEVEQT